MTQVIVWRQQGGVVGVILPTPEELQNKSIEDIATKDVPTGKPYKIIDVADLPPDRSERNGWTVDDAELTDGVGG